MNFGNTWTCRVCNKTFKKKSAMHLKAKHNMTTEEYDKKHDLESYFFRQAIQFFNEYYITTRYKYVKFLEKTAVTVDSNKDENIMALNDSILKRHLTGKDLIAVHFPSHFTKLLAFDIDLKNFDIVTSLVELLEKGGIHRKNMLISFSGGKGYHLDIFLDKIIDKTIAKEFFNEVLDKLDIPSDQKEKVETRGASLQAYKLPLGFKKLTYCHIYDDKLKPLEEKYALETLEVLNTREKLDINIIKKIAEVQLNVKSALEESEIIEFEDIEQEVNPLQIYQNTLDERIKKVENIISEGLKDVGNRNNRVYEIALYLKDIKGLCLADAKEFISSWIQDKWTSNALDKYIKDKEKKSFMDTVESAYKPENRFMGAQSISLTVQDIKEILSPDVKNELINKALRKLYFILLLHSKAYADKFGVFYMSYEQMTKSGATNRRDSLKNQLDKLVELGKVIVVSRNERKGKGYMKKPNEYKLVNLFNYVEYDVQVKIFRMCDESSKCENCLERAMCHLLTDKDRRKYLKGKEYKQVGECPINKQ